MSQWWSRRDSGNITYGELWPEDPEFSSMVHPHWHSFRPPDPIHNYLAGAYIGIIGLTGVFENLLVIVLFTLDPVLRTPTNLLILNLAVSDLIFSAVNGFPLKTLAAFNQRWPWGRQGNYIPEGFHTSCTFDYLSTDWGNVLFNAGMYIFGFLMPVLMLVLSYWKIVLKSRRSKLNLFNLSRSEAREDSSGVICVTSRNGLDGALVKAKTT
ncbi:unnamed protein product [Calicophoron daubneyi]|uniref:G-protein coupled receptors family 1 profile domain-containing protein n=1 Tax=Calicophoron daubneyi TaxID=300641 RepID=A0AAV2TKE1_CALDB